MFAYMCRAVLTVIRMEFLLIKRGTYVCTAILLSVNECNGSAKVLTSSNGSHAFVLDYPYPQEDVTMLTWE